MKHIALVGLFAASVAQGIVGQAQKPLEVTAAVKMELAKVIAVEEQQKDYKQALQLYKAAVKNEKLSDRARQYASYRLASLLKRLGKAEQAKAVLRAAGKGLVVALDDVTNDGQDPEREKQLRLQARELLKALTTTGVAPGGNQGANWYGQLVWIGAPAVPEVIACLQSGKGRRIGHEYQIARELYRFLWQQGGAHAVKHLIDVADRDDGVMAIDVAEARASIDIDAAEVRAYLDNKYADRAVRFLGVIEPLLDVDEMLALADRGRMPVKAGVLRKLARRDLSAVQLKRALAYCVEGQKGANPEMGKAAELFLTSTEAQQSTQGMLMLMAILPDLYQRGVHVASHHKMPPTPSRSVKPRSFSAGEMAAMMPPMRAAIREIGTVESRPGPRTWMSALVAAFIQSGSEEAVRLGIEMWDLGYRIEHAFHGHATPDTAVELLKRFDKLPKQNRDRFFWAFAADDMTPAAFPVLCELAQMPGIGKSSTKAVIRLIGQTGHEDAAGWLAAEWRKGAVEGNAQRHNELYVNALVEVGRADKSERVRIAMRNMVRGFGGPRLDATQRAKLMLALMSMRDERVLDFIATGIYGGGASHPYPEKNYHYKQKPLHYLGSRNPRPAHGYSAEQITATFKRLLAYEKRSPISARSVFPASIRDDVMVILATGERRVMRPGTAHVWPPELVKRLAKRIEEGGDVAVLERCFLSALGRDGESDLWLGGSNDEVLKRYRKQISELIDGDDEKWAMAAITGLQRIEPIDALPQLKNRNALVREWAMKGLVYGDKKALPKHIIPMMRDTSPRTRELAAMYLGAVVAKEAVPGLIELLRDGDGDVRKHAAEALTRIRFYHEQQAHWDRVLKGLDASPASAAEKLLVQAKPEAKKEQRLLAIKSLGVLGAPEALPFLIDWSQEKDKEIGAAARAAITEIHLKPRK